MKHVYRVMLLIGSGTLLLGWTIKHSEPSSNIGLRYIHQAEQIAQGEWHNGVTRGIDHPLHPLLIVATHNLVGGEGPGSWQRSALVLGFTSSILLVVPVYLLTLELFGGQAAWLACVLAIGNPIIGYIVVNVLSESTFLLWWTFGMWASARFLREGQFVWLPLAAGFGGLAYLTRPEGILSTGGARGDVIDPAALACDPDQLAALVARTRFLGRRTCVSGRAVHRPQGGPGDQTADRARARPDRPGRTAGARTRYASPPDQDAFETYRLAALRTITVFRDAVTLPLVPFALLGIIMAARQPGRARAVLFLGIVLAAAAAALFRLHATAGYCAPRHGIVVGMLMTMAAAHAICGLVQKVSIPGRWLGLPHERLRPGPAIWAALLAVLIVPIVRDQGPINSGPYSLYHSTGEWLAQNTIGTEQVLDLTDWSLYFSKRPGYNFAHVYQAPADPHTRWLVVREGQISGRQPYSPVIRDLIGGREPVARLPVAAAPHQLRIQIYDLKMANTHTADAAVSRTGSTWRR